MVSVVGFKGRWFLSLVSKVGDFCRWFQRFMVSVVGFKVSWFLSFVSKVGDFCRWFQRSVISVLLRKQLYIVKSKQKADRIPVLKCWRSLATFTIKCLNGLQNLLFLRKSTYKITLLLLLDNLFLPLIGMEQSSSWLCAVKSCLARIEYRSTLWDSMTMMCQCGPQIVLKSCALLLGVYVYVARPNHTGLLSQIW